MKLYELIELGSTIVPEKHADYQGCVIGTAAKALGVKGASHDFYKALGAIPELHLNVDCPQCHGKSPRFGASLNYMQQHPEGTPLLWLADHLHTYHSWSRQRIAEWLKPIEDTCQPQPESESKTENAAMPSNLSPSMEKSA